LFRESSATGCYVCHGSFVCLVHVSNCFGISRAQARDPSVRSPHLHLVCGLCAMAAPRPVQRPLLTLASCSMGALHHIQSIQPDLCGLDRSGPVWTGRTGLQVRYRSSPRHRSLGVLAHILANKLHAYTCNTHIQCTRFRETGKDP
jgi:hypothetical protein